MVSLLNELSALANQIGDCCDQAPCSAPTSASCCPCTFPFAQVMMSCPPPCLAPTRPEPVKPLCIPCPQPPPQMLTPEEREVNRVDNFYNSYNLDWHDRDWGPSESMTCDNSEQKRYGVTVDGQSPCCCCPKKNDDCPPPGCPTGFKPCTMKLTAPPCCHPLLPWCAEIQPCPPKSKKKKKTCGGNCS